MARDVLWLASSRVFGGATGAATLFGTGVIALDSFLWWVAPVGLAAVGLLLGAAAPFGRANDRAEPFRDTDAAAPQS